MRFPWFTVQQDGDADAYCQFISALHAMARDQKRINHCPDTSDNEKYAFRCFLIRLGFVGSEFKAARKVLLRHLTGSSAFRHGRNSNAIPNKKYIEQLRKKYPVGTKIQLISMRDETYPVLPGTIGKLHILMT